MNEENFRKGIYEKKDVTILSPDDGYHYFFGYYDMRASSSDGKHLCHRVPFMDHQPTKDDVAEVGYIKDRKFYKIGETTAWNFQQGAMLQFAPNSSDTVYYNVVVDGEYKTAIHDFIHNTVRYVSRATACVSPDGKKGLAVNFGRIFAFRPGYGYDGFNDEYSTVNAPENDGCFLVDMQTGSSKLMYSMKDLQQKSGFSPDQKLLINHITFNTTSDKFVMLVRNFFSEEHPMWLTSMMVADLNNNVKTVLKTTYVSHYYWLNSDEILAHCSAESPDKKILYKINVESGEIVPYDMPYFHGSHNPDIHCITSPEQTYVIGDGYPIDGYRYLEGYNLLTNKSSDLFAVKTTMPKNNDIRCDLHARFVFDGTQISFDTTMNGKREIATVKSDKLPLKNKGEIYETR